MNLFRARTSEFLKVFQEFSQVCEVEVFHIAEAIYECFTKGGKLLICGNGGSAADSQHLAAEFVSSFAHGLGRKSLPALSLTVDTSILTAIANDFGYEKVFSRQIEGLGNPSDCVLFISTSGESTNVLHALVTAKRMGLKVLSLTKAGSSLQSESDFSIAIPSNNTQHIQECHVFCYHIITEIVENRFMGVDHNAV